MSQMRNGRLPNEIGLLMLLLLATSCSGSTGAKRIFGPHPANSYGAEQLFNLESDKGRVLRLTRRSLRSSAVIARSSRSDK